ncbi:hypothetical protein HDV00_004851 [Rhizophlyctis rosea]|nr:hypothetical protein HDV00_004851 [Rhizophlyctis rosea]
MSLTSLIDGPRLTTFHLIIWSGHLLHGFDNLVKERSEWWVNVRFGNVYWERSRYYIQHGFDYSAFVKDVSENTALEELCFEGCEGFGDAEMNKSLVEKCKHLKTFANDMVQDEEFDEWLA